MEYLYHNQFSKLHNTVHNDIKILFYKHELLNWPEIANLGPVILISGNTDEAITTVNLPENVVHWYAGNALVRHPKLTCLPLGLENAGPCLREGHGVVWPRGIQRIEKLTRMKPEKLTPMTTSMTSMSPKFCLANFSIGTNPNHRSNIAALCKQSPCIDYVEWMSMDEFLESAQQYECIVCPEGNGKDTHRFWEVLYLGKVPLVFSKDLYETLYFRYPAVLVKPEDLLNESYLREAVSKRKAKPIRDIWYEDWATIITTYHKKMFAFDVGAYEGKWTRDNVSAGLVSRAVCVEASPGRCRAMGLPRGCERVCAAVTSSTEPTIAFYEAGCLSSINPEWYTIGRFAGTKTHKVSAPTVTLDSLIATYGKPDLIKIDVEGAELDVLRSLTQKVSLLCFEWASELSVHECIDYLVGLGFTEFSVQSGDAYTFRPTEYMSAQGAKDVLDKSIRNVDWGMVWCK